mmetsp:Transcript_124056/g.347412  ORF Transcript_124056/g.347412 Transcript_124056/m.347412 type:complete len:267 (+) Transcript_124056:136-936(+)
MPASSDLMSSTRVAIVPSISSMASSESEMDCSKPFFLSSVRSSCLSQYSFFASSSTCSFFKVFSMSSIILMTFSKPIFLPFNAIAMRSSCGRVMELAAAALEMMARACPAAVARLSVPSCTKLALPALGNVFLKRSRASSSFNTLMVSAIATSSSARVFLISSHSAVLVLQLVSSSIWNFVSASSAALVSSKSFAMPAICTPISPTRIISSSICLERVSTSLFFAAIKALKFSMAAVSSVVASSKSFCISSSIVFKMPVISPLAGA